MSKHNSSSSSLSSSHRSSSSSSSSKNLTNNNSGGDSTPISSNSTNNGDEKNSSRDVYDEQMTENPNAYYSSLINKWLDQYTTTVHRRVSSIVDCSPSLFIILYESISKDNPNTNPKQYPKFIRDKTLTLSQNQHNLIELISYLKEKYKHSFILRNIDARKILEREPYEIIKLLDWFIQLERKRVQPYIPHLDDPNRSQSSTSGEEGSFNESFSIRHRRKILEIQRDKLEREHNSFIYKTMTNVQSKEESLLRQYLTHSNRIEKENLVLSVNTLKKKENDMKCKLQDRKDSISNFYKDQMNIIKEKLGSQTQLDKQVSRQLFLDFDRLQREFHAHKQKELELRRLKYMSKKEKEQFQLHSKLKTMLDQN